MKPLYIDKPTKQHRLNNLSKKFAADLYIKREDKSNYLCNGGNKCRKLEYIMENVLSNDCDTVITCGAVQSNHCMLTLSAAKKEQLDCHIVLEQRIPNSYIKNASGNNYLYNLLDAHIYVVGKGKELVINKMNEIYNSLVTKGKKPIIIAGGGSEPLGVYAYTKCAEEIENSGQKIDYVFTTSGSGGTHAGLALGFSLLNSNTKVIGISNNRKKQEQVTKINNLINDTIKYMRLDVKNVYVEVNDEFIGKGYSIDTEGMKNAIKLFAQDEGILLDTVYTGKCADGFLSLCQEDRFRNKKLLFIHTGGSTTLFHYKP
jgi:D-cysteine desulfhydrase